jgi:tetratricopeptide (TPR) repeat protein
MKRLAGFALGLVLLAPCDGVAQTRPSSTMHTNSAELYFGRAMRSTREDEKKQLLEKALGFALDGIKAREDNPKAYLIAGRIQAQLGNAAAADSMFDRAEQLWPEYLKETDADRMQAWVRAYNAGIVAMRDHNQAEAIAHFENATSVYDKRPGAHVNLGQLYARQNQADKAIAAYRGALTILSRPENQEELKPEERAQNRELEEIVIHNLGQLLATSGKDEEAVATYREFLERSPNHTQVKSNLAVVLSRMGQNQEAAQIYNELLAQELSAEEFFAVGVGLFRSTQHEAAAQAFRKAVSKNPHMRDALYNLSQARYALAGELEGQKSGAAAEAARAIDARLIPIYTEIAEITEKLRTIDPANRTVVALQSRAYRALADLSVDDEASTAWRNKTVEALKIHEGLLFTLEDITATVTGDVMRISGNVVNQKGTAGQTVKVRMYVLGGDGQPLDKQEVSVALPDVQGATPFRIEMKGGSAVLGWKYEVIN